MYGNTKQYPKPRVVDHITMQGMTQINDATSGCARRFLWILILFSGLIFTAFNIAKQIKMFRSKPISVNIDIRLAEVLPFPTITICNTNILKRSKTDHLNITDEVKLVMAYSFEKSDAAYNLSAVDLAKVDDLSQTRATVEVALSVNDSLLWSSWEGRQCAIENFTHKFTDIGLCFSFNANGSLLGRNSGRQYGLHISLNALSEEFLRSAEHTEGHGFLIAVHSHDVPPLMNELGMAVYPGSHYFYGMDVQEVSAPDGLSNCGNKKLKLYDGNYSREACRIECFTQYIVQHCSCKDAFMPSNVSTCTPAQMVTCFHPTRTKYLYDKSECESSCPQTCSYKVFNVKSSSNLILTDEYLQTLGEKTNKTKQYWKKNYIGIDLFMTSMSYTCIQKRYSYSILDLFCDIGGALGLALGASILTCVEFVDFSIRYIQAYWGYKTGDKNVGNTSKQSESDLPEFDGF